MKKVIILGLAMALVGGVAYANFCARDAVPAATLLFPYVVVDVDSAGAPDPAGYTTITGIVNVSRPAIIVHFTAWDATSVPRIDFDEILSGYDVLQINWRDFLNGRFDLFDTSRTDFTASIPKTFDPFEWGPDGRGQPTGVATLTTAANRNTITTTQCPTVPPYGNRSDLASTIRGLLNGVLVAYTHDGCAVSGRALRTDKSTFGSALTAAPIFFYVTADVVNACNLNFPSDDAYWTTPGFATTNNVITGDVIYLKPPTLTGGGYSESFPAVHIEAVAAISRTAVYPFYGEKTTQETRREPLATAFGFRYFNDPAASITSNVMLWKNFAEVPDAAHVSDCGSYMYYAWDMDERSLSTTTQPISGITTAGLDPNQFPFETQKVPLTTAYFDLPDAYGWMLVILPPSYVFSAGWADPTNDTPSTTGTVAAPKYYMGWAATQVTYGAYSTSIEAWTMASYMCYTNQVLPQLGANPGLTIANTYGFITTP